MRRELYTCSICGEQYTDLDAYLECVSTCVEAMKEAKEAEYFEEINNRLGEIKSAQKLYEQLLDKFKEDFPDEYELNFETKSDKATNSTFDPYKYARTVAAEFSCDNKGNRTFNAKVDGKDVDEKDIQNWVNDPSLNYLVKLLGIE